MMFFSTRRRDWSALENVYAKDWIVKLVRPARLRAAVGAAVRAEILRVCRQHLGGLDLDAHQARRHLAHGRCCRKSWATSRAVRRRWSRRWCGRSRPAGRHVAARRPRQPDHQRGRAGDRRRRRRRAAAPADAVISHRADALRLGAGARPAGCGPGAPTTPSATSAWSASCCKLAKAGHAALLGERQRRRASRSRASSSSRTCAGCATRWSTFRTTCRQTHPKFSRSSDDFVGRRLRLSLQAEPRAAARRT